MQLWFAVRSPIIAFWHPQRYGGLAGTHLLMRRMSAPTRRAYSLLLRSDNLNRDAV